ncbi:MAG: hypothetical protein RJA36_818 [Pseudomonadota bacterium]
MRAVLDHLTANDEIGLVGFGQSNRLPNGDRDAEGFIQAPHLKLRAPGMDLTIAAIVSATGGVHGAAGTQSVVSVGEALTTSDWVNGELRLVQHEFQDSVASSLRRGHAKVLANAAINTAATGGLLIFDTATNTVIWPSHGRRNGAQVTFATTGTLPGLTAGAVYYVRDVTDSTFKLAASPYGSVVVLAGGSGTHTITGRAFLLVEWQSEFQAPTAGVTFSIATPGVVNHTAHDLPEGSTVSFDVNVPPELTAGVKYFVVDPTTNAYNVSATLGGAAINFSGAGGAATATPDTMAFVAGYVHLHDRFNSYDNVHVVTPYQPIEPGDYPAGTPVVPGFTLQADVTSYADAAVVLPFAWNEGIDGYGAAGTATVSGLVVTLQGGLTIQNKLFAGGFVRVGGAKGKVASNTTTTVTVESWTPTAGPGAGTLPFHVHLPHWRNNPHHHTAGEGFLYPSGNSQPGANNLSSNGIAYSRPRGRLTSAYVSRSLVSASVGTAINATGIAKLTTTGSGQLTCSIVSGKLRIQRATNTNDPATGLIQFEHLVRVGSIVGFVGMNQTPGIDTFWRVVGLQHATAAAGSWIDCDVVEGVIGSVPGAVAGTVPSGAVITRMTWQPVHKFGALIETAWRMATALGRRLVVAHLGITAAGQVLALGNNQQGYQGKLGWWDDDECLDWTPSNPSGCAARLQRLVEFIAPRAVKATFGTSKTWRVLAIDGWQAETDSTTVAGRELARRSIPTFVSWLRSLISTAGLSPYPADAKIPVQWAQITNIPWEIAGLGGDVDGAVNAAITRMAQFDGFAASVDPDVLGSPKLADTLHFNGVGEALNGKAAAEALLPLIDFAFQFRLGPDAIALANDALTLLGEPANVTALEPPNATTQARLCAQFMHQARASVLQAHPWTFATRRVVAVEVENTVTSWLYAYAVPADCLHPLSVLPADATDDLQIRSATYDPTGRYPLAQGPLAPASQPFTIETDQEGHRVLRTNLEAAALIYTARNVPFELWDPLVRQACAYRLAYLMAGAILKGKTGAAMAQQMLQMSAALMQQAAAVNANYQRDARPVRKADWLP